MANPRAAAGDLSPERQQRARGLARLSRRLILLEGGLEALLLLAFLFSGASAALRDLLPGGLPRPVGVALYLAVSGAAYGVLFSPLAYYRGYVLPRRYGLSAQDRGAWLVDRLKGAGLAAGLGLAVGLFVYWLLASYPGTWWLWAGLFLVLVSVLLTHLAPVLILPLFLKVRPLTDPSLSRRLHDLAGRAGVRVKGIFVAELSALGTTANAGLLGLGPTRRIVVSDTLVGQYTPEEVEAVVAHELGHHCRRDIPRLILVQSLLIFLSFYLADLVLRRFSPFFGFAGPDDVANFPLLLLALGAVVMLASPLVKALSRHLEMSADTFALALPTHPEAFLTALAKLTDDNLSQARPARWQEWLFYDHPPYYRRRENADRYLSRKNQIPSTKYETNSNLKNQNE